MKREGQCFVQSIQNEVSYSLVDVASVCVHVWCKQPRTKEREGCVT